MTFNPAQLSQIDAVDVVSLESIYTNASEYMEQASDAPYIRVVGESAQQIASLWRELPSGEQDRCHIPPFGLRFYYKNNLIAQCSICWRCNNIFGDNNGNQFFFEFDAEDAISQQLFISCRKHHPVKILETERTILREVTETDAEFILDLLNQPSFIKYIGDRNVRTVDQARNYVESRFAASYKQFGFGMYAVELKTTGETIGICGFVKRDSLPDADIGFAFLAQFEKQGFGFETASAMMQYGEKVLNFERVLAITTKDNEASVKLLEKLGFEFDRLIQMPPDEQKLKLFSANI